ncbi:MAG: STAS domain-containing protein [Deltaproteobacteria bacterium]|jgi:rsbT antagonist protein RsbS|nr:STAS domain-containing protein [Deltaproteobacteria bacterium]
MEPFSTFSLEDILLVSIQEEIDDSSIEHLLHHLGKQVSKNKTRAVIIDMHDVEVMDTFLAEHIEELVSFLHMLRSRVVVAGIQVPVALTLTDFNIRLKNVEFALDVEQALARLR